jgi:hypothetical protein
MTERRQEEKRLWPAEDQTTGHPLNSEFVAAVVARVRKRVIYKELLFLIVPGFWSIILGFLKINPSQSAPQTQQERHKQ